MKDYKYKGVEWKNLNPDTQRILKAWKYHAGEISTETIENKELNNESKSDSRRENRKPKRERGNRVSKMDE